MRQTLSVQLVVVILFLSLASHSQQPVLEVKSLEYTWIGGNGSSHIILAVNDSVKLRIKNSFAKAIKGRWNITFPQASFSAKPLPFLVYNPKFKTPLKEKEPSKWYLFLQVYEKDNGAENQSDGDQISTILDVRCRIISGANDSVITDKTLTVNILERSLPPDQVPLKRLPAYPNSFVQGFDSIATWLFQREPVSQKTLDLKPACIFQASAAPDKPISNLTFERDVIGIHQLSAPSFTLEPSTPKYEKTGIKRNAGGRSIGGAFTLLTGLGSSKTKYYYYKADYSYKDKDTTWLCGIGYVEEETANRERVKNESGSYSMQSSDYSLSARYMDAHVQNVITINGDTLATFKIANKTDPFSLTNYDHMWDGKDSTSIIPLPSEWNNKIPERDMIISGKLGKDAFTMITWKGIRIKEFYINNQPVITVLGRSGPLSGQVFHPVSAHQLKAFAILSSLPYSYFNGTN